MMASASPRRRKILEGLCATFETAVPEVEEVHYADQARRSALENAARKHAWARARFPGRRIIAADTVIDLGGQCIGKPDSLESAIAMFRSFSGREHAVLTAVALTGADGEPVLQVLESRVRFRHLDEPAIREYFRRVDPLDKAGAYDIDQHAGLIVESYSGSVTNIMGLPAAAIRAWLGTSACPAPVFPKPLHIGSLRVAFPFLLAPMAGYTDVAMRMLCRRYGCGLAFTEVACAEAVARRLPRTLHLFETAPGDQPLVAHLYGADPSAMADAARVAESMGRFAAIDLNCGCPVRKVVARGAGAALIKTPERIVAIVRAMRAAVSLPVTVKTRIGFSEDAQNISELAHAVEEAGAAAIYLHARVAARKHSGPADWDALARVKAERKIPIVGNGGVVTADDALRMLRATGVDGVMIGRAAVGHPWIFADIQARLRGEPALTISAEQRMDLILEHLRRLTELKAIENTHRRRALLSAEQGAVLHLRGHLHRYLAGQPGWSAERRFLSQLKTAEDVRGISARVFCGSAVSAGSGVFHADVPDCPPTTSQKGGIRGDL